MSLLPTPTFAGATETETFYVRQSAPNVAGVSSVNSIAGAVGITASDASLTFTNVGQNVQITTAGNPFAPSSVAATGNISAGGTLSAVGATTLGGNTAITGTLSASGAATFGSIVGSSFRVFSSGTGSTGTYTWVVGNVRVCVGQATTDGGGAFALSLPAGCPAFSANCLYANAMSTEGANNAVCKGQGLTSTTGASFRAYDPSTKASTGAGINFCCIIIGLV